MALTQARDNKLLAALPAAELARLGPHLKLTHLPLGLPLYESQQRQETVYFPTTAVVSLVYTMLSGSSAEVAAVGHEGMIGVSVFMGGETTLGRAVVQTSGHAYQMSAEIFMLECKRPSALRQRLLSYTDASFAEMTLNAACSRHHQLPQRLCRWLLLSFDRSGGHPLTMTHEGIGSVLGVRREGISEAAGQLQRAGLIQYQRGRITLLDRPALEARACECYSAHSDARWKLNAA